MTSSGCQIDLLAEVRTGIIRHRLMVECKDYALGNTVGIEEVKEFSGALAAARGRTVDKGLLVARSGFSRQAREFAECAGIDLVNFSDLQNQLVDFDAYLDRVVADYEGAPVSKHYVELSFSETEDFASGDNALVHRPLEDAVNRILISKQSNKLALLGNFGTGKTTWCKKYARDMALKYKREREGRIPILVTLSDYDSNVDIQQLITNTLQYSYGVRIDAPVCQELQRLGRFLFLFDGFDEMATRVDADVVRENLREIEKIGRIASNAYILTCRTHFFRDRVQAEVLANFDILYIPEWGETELREYLQRRFEDGWERQLDRIHGTHNLAELAQTPLFLEMITETLPKLGDEVRRSELYDKYTQDWITEQSRRRGARLQAADRRAFVVDLATRLYRDNKLGCHYTEFPSLLKARFKVEDAAQMDYLQSDVQSCTFVTRIPSGHYEFRHKSFMEFFVAKAITEHIKTPSFDLLAAKLLPVEIRQFLSELLQNALPIDTLRSWLESAPDGVLRDNIHALMIDLRIPLVVESLQTVSADEPERTILEFLQGNAEAFGRVYAQHAPDLTASLVRMGADLPVAQDIVSDVFIRLLERRQQLSSVKNFRGYLFTLARRRFFDYCRRESRLKPVSDDIPFALDSDELSDHQTILLESIVDESQAAEVEERKRLESRIEDALSQLSTLERTVVERCMLQGEMLSTVARDLDRPLAAVRTILNFARQKLRKLLSEPLDGDEK